MPSDGVSAGRASPDFPEERELCVIVLGVFRSGTSVVAGMLDRLGVRMGPHQPKRNWMEVSPWSPTGTYENEEFRWFDWAALGVDARTPQRSLPDDWRERMTRVPSSEVSALVRSTQGGAWGWKDPYTVLTLPLYLPHVRNPRLVVVRRKAADVAESIHRQDWASAEEAKRLVRIVTDELDADLDRFREVPRLELSFDEVARSPEDVVDRLVGFLGLDCSPSAKAAAVSLIRSKPAQLEATRRLAVAELAKTPKWLSYAVVLELRFGSRGATPIFRAAWRKLAQTFRLATSAA